MRCSCANCDAFMVNDDGRRMGCVCPECGYRCDACLGTNTVISREELANLKNVEWFTPNFESPVSDEDDEG